MYRYSSDRSSSLLVSALLLVAAVVVTPQEARSQAWTKPPGELYAKLSYGTATASEQYSFDGQAKNYADNVSEDAFFDRSLYLYGELGLTPKLTLIAALPFKRVIVRDATFRYRTFGFGNAQVGVRYKLDSLVGLTSGSDAVAANATLSIPTGYTRNYTPSVGAGQVDAELNLAYGHSFYPFPAYAQAALGYRYRSDIYLFSSGFECVEGVDKNCFADSKPAYSDDLLLGVEAGATIADRVLLQTIARLNWSVTEPTTGFSVSNPIPTKQRFLKLGGGLAVTTIKNLNLSAQMFFTPYGRNTVNSLDLFIGIDYTFDVF